MPMAAETLLERAKAKFYHQSTGNILVLAEREKSVMDLIKVLAPYSEDRADGTKTIDVLQDKFVRT